MSTSIKYSISRDDGAWTRSGELESDGRGYTQQLADDIERAIELYELRTAAEKQKISDVASPPPQSDKETFGMLRKLRNAMTLGAAGHLLGSDCVELGKQLDDLFAKKAGVKP